MKTRIFLFFSIAVIFCFVLLQYLGEYHFYYIEQYQLFRFSDLFIKSEIFQINGLNNLITDFFLQFFGLHYVGAIFSSLCIGAIGILSVDVIRKTFNSSIFSCLMFLTSVAFIPLQLNNHFYLTGSFGFLTALVLINLFCCKEGAAYGYISLIVSVIFYVFFGPAAIFFSTVIFIARFKLPKSNRLLGIYLISPILILFVGIMLVRLGIVANLKLALTPALYYESLISAPIILYMPYIIVYLGFIFGLVFDRKTVVKSVIVKIVSVVCLIIFGTLFIAKDEMKNSLKEMRFKQLDYYTTKEDWNAIIENCRNGVDNFLYMNFLNLALLQEGKLGDEMFNYDQRGVISLWVPWNKESHVSTLLGEIALASGQTSMAQRMFFEGEVSLKSSISSRHLKQLIKISISKGEYEVANKYLLLLSQTLLYKDWVDKYRSIIEKEKLISQEKRMAFQEKVNLSQEKGSNYISNDSLRSDSLFNDEPFFEFNDIISQNEECDNKSVQFQGAYLLLKKDLNGFKKLIERYYGTPALTVLPKSFQEGVIAYSETDPDYWKTYGVENDCISRFNKFKSLIRKQRDNDSAANSSYKSFGNTFWFFYMFK
ncbi:MAG: DUF6057 family protein [Bacteroidales bacterium]|nr:DUF6057 family protein [Bacteroidales bacterium]